eukprot:3156444-Amphidinium_carterae.1
MDELMTLAVVLEKETRIVCACQSAAYKWALATLRGFAPPALPGLQVTFSTLITPDRFAAMAMATSACLSQL